MNGVLVGSRGNNLTILSCLVLQKISLWKANDFYKSRIMKEA
jgi:hypothetical protein